MRTFLLFTSSVPRRAPLVHQHTFKWSSTATLAPVAAPCSALPLTFCSDVNS